MTSYCEHILKNGEIVILCAKYRQKIDFYAKHAIFMRIFAKYVR